MDRRAPTTARLSLCLFVVVCLFAPYAGAHGQDKPAASPPLVCEIRQRAWCIIGYGQVIEDRGTVYDEHNSEIRKTLWRIYEKNWADQPALVLEPFGCRNSLADTFELAGIDGNFPFEGRKWDRARVRLKKDGACDLELLFPMVAGDPRGLAFGMVRSGLRACLEEACEGNKTVFGYILSGMHRE